MLTLAGATPRTDARDSRSLCLGVDRASCWPRSSSKLPQTSAMGALLATSPIDITFRRQTDRSVCVTHASTSSVRIVKVDTDEESDLASQLQVRVDVTCSSCERPSN
jgi:hypothetical protein